MIPGTVISIEPRLAPALCGTSTYGWTLAQHWPAPRPRFVHLVVDGAQASREFLGTPDIFESGQSAARLCRQIGEFPDAHVILHYASRGFQRYGCPWWLARGLARWRRGHARARLVVFFHEVPQPLPLSSRHWLLEKVNRRIIKKIARLADAVVTNTAEHAARLEGITGARGIPFFPVPSNIPAPENAQARAQTRRPGDFVVFGLPFTRLLTIQLFAAELASWHAAGILQRLHLIGPEDQKFTPQTGELLRNILPAEAVVRHGALGDAQVSEVLMQAGFCLTQSRSGNYSKSGTFSAFAAHGCPVMARLDEPHSTQAPICHLIRPAELQARESLARFPEFVKRGESLCEWYRREADWPAVSARIARLYGSTPGYLT